MTITKLDDLIENGYVFNKIKNLLLPFKFILGLISICLSMMILGSVLISTTERLMNSTCGWNCGFKIQNRTFENILEKAFKYGSSFLSLDKYVLAILLSYLVICLIYGVVTTGVRIGFIQIYEFKKSKTNPQALVSMSFIFTIVAISSVNIMHLLANNAFTINNKIFDFSSKLPYSDHAEIICSCIFCLITVYSMSTSYNSNPTTEIDLLLESDDEERALLSMA